jgi:hypothetical protein
MAIMVKLDNSRVLFAFKKAPAVFGDEIDHWMNKERIGFIGKRNSPTSTAGIKGKLYHKETESGKPGWPRNFVEQLASIKTGGKTLNAKMVMGLIGPNAKMHSVIKFFEHGGIINSGHYMPIPNLYALKYYGIYNQKQAADFYKTTFGNKNFELVPGNDGNYYLLSGGANIEAHRIEKHGAPDPGKILLYTLSKKAKVKKQFNFSLKWAKRFPSIMRRGEQAIFRATRRVEKAISTGDISGF